MGLTYIMWKFGGQELLLASLLALQQWEFEHYQKGTDPEDKRIRKITADKHKSKTGTWAKVTTNGFR